MSDFKVGDIISEKETPEIKLVISTIINENTKEETLVCFPFEADVEFDWYYLKPNEVFLTKEQKDLEYVILRGNHCPSRFTLGKKYLVRGVGISSNAVSIKDDNGEDSFVLVGGKVNCAHLKGYACWWEFVSKNTLPDEIIENSTSTGFVTNEKGGVKGDGNKVRPTILLKDLNHSTNAVIRVLEYGAKKYSRMNYSLVEDERYEDAIGRHYLAYLNGEELDDETGESHLAHIVCCAMFLMEKNKGE